MNTEEKKVEINGNNPEYGENAKEILDNVVNGKIRDYILITNDDEKESLTINIGSCDFGSLLKLDEVTQRVTTELRKRINIKMLDAIAEGEIVKRLLTMHIMGEDGDMIDAVKGKLEARFANNQKEEGGADE